MAYFDAARDRVEDHAEARFRDRVEAARLGFIFAHDANSYARWSSRRAQPAARAQPSDDVILRQIGMLADLFPGNILHGTVS